MNKSIKGLLAATLLISGVVYGSTTNKTFLNPRSVGVDLARQQVGFHQRIHTTRREDSFGAEFQANVFWQESNNETGVGKYFGFTNSAGCATNSFTIGAPGSTVDIDSRNIIHNPTDNADFTLNETFELRFDQESWGVELTWFQNLDSIVDGFYFLVNLPIAHVENEVDFRVCDSEKVTITKNGMDTEVGIEDYFKGLIVQDASTNQQQAGLSKAKICGSHSDTQVADLDLIIGWDFWRQASHVGINVGVTFPTSNDPDGLFLFEPCAGNCGHWGLGGGFTGGFTPWKNGDQELEVIFALNYRFLFEDSEVRTVGIKGLQWGHYLLLGESGKAGVFPAANVLTRRVDVEPGSQVDALLGIAYHWDNFIFDIGYNLFARESEDVKLKCFPCDTYGIAGNDYNTMAAFTIDDIASSPHTIGATASKATGTFLDCKDLDPSRAETPGFGTHKLYAGTSYVFKEWDYPLMLKFGGYYEWASSHKALERWSLFGGFAVSV